MSSDSGSIFAEVAVNAGRPLRQPFTYSVPPEMALRVGHAVFVPFGKRVVQGIVLALRDQSDIVSPRPIQALIDPEPLLTTAQAALARWVAEYYLASLYACVALFLPRRMSSLPHRLLWPLSAATPEALAALTDLQHDVLADIGRRGEIDIETLARHRIDGSIDGVVNSLVGRGLIGERYELARAPGPPQPEIQLALALSRTESEQALRGWPVSKRSRKADLIERLQAGPAPQTEARRLAGSRQALQRWLEEAALFGPDDDDSVRLAPRFADHPAAARR